MSNSSASSNLHRSIKLAKNYFFIIVSSVTLRFSTVIKQYYFYDFSQRILEKNGEKVKTVQLIKVEMNKIVPTEKIYKSLETFA